MPCHVWIECNKVYIPVVLFQGHTRSYNIENSLTIFPEGMAMLFGHGKELI